MDKVSCELPECFGDFNPWRHNCISFACPHIEECKIETSKKRNEQDALEVPKPDCFGSFYKNCGWEECIWQYTCERHTWSEPPCFSEWANSCYNGCAWYAACRKTKEDGEEPEKPDCMGDEEIFYSKKECSDCIWKSLCKKLTKLKKSEGKQKTQFYQYLMKFIDPKGIKLDEEKTVTVDEEDEPTMEMVTEIVKMHTEEGYVLTEMKRLGKKEEEDKDNGEEEDGCDKCKT
jgi:hypothetical protein